MTFSPFYMGNDTQPETEDGYVISENWGFQINFMVPLDGSIVEQCKAIGKRQEEKMRLDYEEDIDCLNHMREFIITKKYASLNEIENLEKQSDDFVADKKTIMFANHVSFRLEVLRCEGSGAQRMLRSTNKLGCLSYLLTR